MSQSTVEKSEPMEETKANEAESCVTPEKEKLPLELQTDQQVEVNVTDPTENQDNTEVLESMQTNNDEEVTLDESSKVSEVVAYTPPKFDSVPSLIYEEEFASFTKGVKFCSDGQTFAVCTDDKRMHIRKTVDLLDGKAIPEEITVEKIATICEAQPIHDFAWSPNHEFCAFLTTCNTQPVHLYCGQTGKFFCSYVARNHLDEHISAYSVAFNKEGKRVLAGYKKFVRVFDVECPNIWFEVPTWKQYQAGIVSALDSVGDHMLAVGTYCNTVALYDLRDKAMLHEPEEGHEGGVTQVRFSYDGTLLYSGARKDNFILCRDVRNFSQILQKFPRKCCTNQRVYFDLTYEEDYLATGNTDGTCFIWNKRDLEMFGEDQDKCRPNLVFAPHSDVRLTKSSATNGLSFHKWAPVIATSSGGRTTSIWDDESESVIWESPYENRVKLWKFAQ